MGYWLPLGLTAAALVFAFIARRGVVRLIGLAKHLEESEDLSDCVGKVQIRENVVEAIKQDVDLWSDD